MKYGFSTMGRKQMRVEALFTAGFIFLFSCAALMPAVHAHLHDHATGSHAQADESFCGIQSHVAATCAVAAKTYFEFTQIATESLKIPQTLLLFGISAHQPSRAPPLFFLFAF